MDQKRQRQLANLEIAKTALRDNLHVHFLDDTAPARMGRALAHIREAAIATERGPSLISEHFWKSGQNGV
jgi:hypothetical protein